MTQNNITSQVETILLVSSLTYPHMSNETLTVCPDPKDLNKAGLHKAPSLEDITHTLAGSTTYSKLDKKMIFGASMLHMKVHYSQHLTHN